MEHSYINDDNKNIPFILDALAKGHPMYQYTEYGNAYLDIVTKPIETRTHVISYGMIRKLRWYCLIEPISSGMPRTSIYRLKESDVSLKMVRRIMDVIAQPSSSGS